jgi:hypothetical protein
LNDSVSELQIEASVQKVTPVVILSYRTGCNITIAPSTSRKHQINPGFDHSGELLQRLGMFLTCKYHEDKKAQDALIARQQETLESLMSRRCRQDFVVDGVLALFCLGV